ncbi:MAG: lysophospholipid acyltransferase family protein [Pseudomonadales bacterium]|jgi:1-acyl-sn-glycerol-3-phosphate acyltransferase
MSSATTTTTEVEYGGPHPWQIQPWAKSVRRVMRHKEYTRWTDEYCTPLNIQGREHLDDLNEPAIFIANHQSHMDTPVIMATLPERIRDDILFGAAQDRWFVKGKEKLILQPWYQSLVLGNFPIMRGGGSKALSYASWLLDQGSHICIFPEGTRAMSDELGEFRHGVSLLALKHNVPVVPVVMKGLRELRPKGARHIKPGPVSSSILEPLRFEPGTTVEAATEVMRSTMLTHYQQTVVELPRAA